MKLIAKGCFLLAFFGATFAPAQISNFQHVIVVFQENRTPDNLFQGLCRPPFGKPGSCSTKPTGSQYNIQTSKWLDSTTPGGVVNPGTVLLADACDPSHEHSSFVSQCNLNSAGVCQMDGAAIAKAAGSTCPTTGAALRYVSNTNSILRPYLSLANRYGWANYMFQTNQGPSYPAHQFIFGGTSAPSAADDAVATFASGNVKPEVSGTVAGCMALATTTVDLIDPAGDKQSIYPCFEHETMTDLLDGIGVTWKYYTSGAGGIWTAPNAIQHICLPNAPSGGSCVGSEFTNNVIVGPTHVLTDITDCKLQQVSWVIPSGQYSDHPSKTADGGGPAWVASIVNAIGNNPKCSNGEVYWNNTAIIITWDDWGGWYDHEPPTILAGDQGDYQYGFRVPLIVVSAYTKRAYVDNNRMDFGTILRFVEHNFGIDEGALNFADARAQTDMTEFFNLSRLPRTFQTIIVPADTTFFVDDKRPLTDPDDD